MPTGLVNAGSPVVYSNRLRALGVQPCAARAAGDHKVCWFRG